MNRRKFVKNGIVLSAVPTVLPFLPSYLKEDTPAPGKKPVWLVEMIHRNDQNIENALKRRISDKDDPRYGAVLDGVDIVTPHGVLGLIKASILSLTSPESKWYDDQRLLKDLVDSAKFLLTLQHEDGTIDLVITNFHSTPDTGFLVKYLCPAVAILRKSDVKGKDALLDLLKQFLQNAGKALLVGGVHTPNHRWVVSAALASLHMLWPNQAYVERAETWLSEGIDLDVDGQYQEKSSYIYSSLSDRVLITVARGFNKPELLDYVRKNLDMTFYYIHPNGEIVTEASGRQDNSIIGTLENYYYPYRYLAIKDQNPQYAAACRLIEATAFVKTTGFLQYFLEDETLWQELPKAGTLPVNYFKTFSNSDLIRIRRGNYDASILPNNPAFFTFQKKAAVLQGLRVASAFFGKGQFTAEHYQVENNTIHMERSLEGPYYQPFPKDKIPGDGVWENMPRTERPLSEVQKQTTSVDIVEVEGGFELEITVEGTDNVPLVVELIFRPGGEFKNVTPHENLANVHFLKEGNGKYEMNGDVIEFGPGHYEHKWVDIRGGLPRVDAPSVYLTGITPFKKKIRIS